jgi:hypothetical protein
MPPYWNEDLLHSQMLLQPLPKVGGLLWLERLSVMRYRIAAWIAPHDGFE